MVCRLGGQGRRRRSAQRPAGFPNDASSEKLENLLPLGVWDETLFGNGDLVKDFEDLFLRVAQARRDKQREMFPQDDGVDDNGGRPTYRLERDLINVLTSANGDVLRTATVLQGRQAYTDHAGRVWFDKCATPGEHLEAKTPEGLDRRNCRAGIEDLLPAGSKGKKGTWLIQIEFVPEGGE